MSKERITRHTNWSDHVKNSEPGIDEFGRNIGKPNKGKRGSRGKQRTQGKTVQALPVYGEK